MALLFNILFVNSLFADGATIEFSATAIQRAPGRPDYQRQMYVGQDMVRTDSLVNDIKFIEIVKQKAQKRMLLLPKDKVYMMQQGNNTETEIVSKKTVSTKPCEGLKDTQCEMIGKENINNRQAEKWEFTVEKNEQTYRSLHWIDVERRMLVREFLPDGTVMELIPQGKEKIDGRPTEKWLWQLSGADGQIKSSIQWYDPELKITIREEIPGGFIRELKQIIVGKQNRALFEVPNNFKQVENLQGYLKPLPLPIEQQ